MLIIVLLAASAAVAVAAKNGGGSAGRETGWSLSAKKNGLNQNTIEFTTNLGPIYSQAKSNIFLA